MHEGKRQYIKEFGDQIQITEGKHDSFICGRLSGLKKRRHFPFSIQIKRRKKHNWHIVGAILIDCAVVYKKMG